MIIIDNTKIEKNFCEICVGVVFKREYEEGSKPDVCIKIPSFLDQRTQNEFNAINLEDGSWCQFSPYELVIPYEATLHLDQ